MPELRKDPVIGRWVIISTERAERPNDFKVQVSERQHNKSCPFCPGNEGMTPPEVLAYRPGAVNPNGPGWQLRVVPNKFPALMIEGDLDREGHGLYDRMNGIGAHEVFIETPDHAKSLADLTQGQVESLLWACHDRIIDLRRDSRFRYVLVFKNYGEAAGASLEHSHTQLIALPIIPRRVQAELDGAAKHYEFKERCIYCDIIGQEKREKERVIYENDETIAISPWAPRRPFETWILPKRHLSHFEDSRNGIYPAFADSLLTILRKLKVVLGDFPYNFTIHTSPMQKPELAHFHWHLELTPTLTKIAGFESGSGFYINPMPPEKAAAFIRDAIVS